MHADVSLLELQPEELMAMDLIDLGWDADVIEEAMGQEPGWLAAAMERAALEAQRAGLH